MVAQSQRQLLHYDDETFSQLTRPIPFDSRGGPFQVSLHRCPLSHQEMKRERCQSGAGRREITEEGCGDYSKGRTVPGTS